MLPVPECHWYGCVAATAGIAALVGALGWVAYKTWQIKKAKDAVLEDITANEKYRYPVIEDLYAALHKTYQQAIDTKKAVDDLTSGKTVEESSGHKIGIFTGNWWMSFLAELGASLSSSEGVSIMLRHTVIAMLNKTTAGRPLPPLPAVTASRA